MKNFKKFLMPALIAAIILQLFVPVYMIIKKYDVLNTGEEFRFKVNPVDPYDAFRGRYVQLYYRQEIYGNGKYCVIKVDADGFAYITEITDEKPKNAAYVKSESRQWFSLPITRYYMDEKFAPKAESLVRQSQWEQEAETYVTVRIKNGELVISGLFIDGVSIEDIIKNQEK